MKEQKELPRWLRWPWNLVVYILLAAALRIFAIPIILILLHIQRKHNPNGAAEGYCLSRTRKRLAAVPLGLLVLLIGAAMAVFGCCSTDAQPYERLLGGGLGAAALLWGVYLIFSGVRDSLFPAKSALAKSIRGQLPYPEEAPGVDELFAMVDSDLKENGVWFDTVGIGREWILGDEASRIDRIRGIFTVDRIRQQHSKTGTKTSRVLQLVLVDDRWKAAITAFRDPRELQAAADCLALRVPEAHRGGSYLDFLSKNEEEREAFLQQFRRRAGMRRAGAEQAQYQTQTAGEQSMVLTLSDGSVTSRVTPRLLEQQLAHCLEQEDGALTLTPGRAVARGDNTFVSLSCYTSSQEEPTGQEIMLLFRQSSDRQEEAYIGYCLTTGRDRALDIMTGWLAGRVPDLRDWSRRQLYIPQDRRQATQGEVPPPRLGLLTKAGVFQKHNSFVREDVQVAADGLVDGTYQTVDLTLPGGYLWFCADAGDKTDGRCTVVVTRPGPDKLRFFTAHCTHRQAAAWMMEYWEGTFQPDGRQWKDCTRKMTK